MSSPAVTPLAMNLGPTEILLIILVVILLFGAKKLPELARGSGRALRIFKAETKGLLDDDDDPDGTRTDEQRQIDAQQHRAQPAQPINGPVNGPIETPVETEQPRPDTER
jgi:sec-independent protein translocase protein TatA